MYSIITISGRAGSGKSTVARELAKLFSAKRIYVGAIRRELAKEKGMSLDELNEYALTHSETDIDIDERISKAARREVKKQNLIVEGRTQYHFLPESIKIYLDVNFKEAAKRIWNALQDEDVFKKRNEGNLNSEKDVLKSIKEREKNDIYRYKKYYNIDYMAKSNYDLVIDTTNISADKVIKKIFDFVNLQIKKY